MNPRPRPPMISCMRMSAAPPITRRRWAMTREQTFDKLYRMKLHGMAKALEEQLKQPDMADLSFEERLAMLVDAQWIWRENRSLATRLSAAKLKQPASME